MITYLEAALALEPEAYDSELPSGISGCPDFYFPDAPVSPDGCRGFDCCVDCWARQYQGEAGRAGLGRRNEREAWL